MSTPNGWLVVQRELTGSIQVRDAPEIWFMAVFSTPSRNRRRECGLLRPRLARWCGAPGNPGSRTGRPPGPPTVVVAAPGLVDQVREVLRAEGIRASVDEVVSPDWAEDMLTELAGHLAGRVQVAEGPAGPRRALLREPLGL